MKFTDIQRIIIEDIYKLVANKPISELVGLTDYNQFNKSATSQLIRKVIFKDFIFTEREILEYDLKIKTIPVNENYKCFEAMAFPTISLRDILFEEWSSEDELVQPNLYQQLNKIIVFIPIVKPKNSGYFAHWSEWRVGELSVFVPSAGVLQDIGKEWLKAKEIVKRGVKIREVPYGDGYRKENNLLKATKTKYIHLRPHAKNSYDYDLDYSEYTRGEVEITKQSFWLNKEYINYILKEYRWKKN